MSTRIDEHDVLCLMGLSKEKSPYRIYMEKKGKAHSEKDMSETRNRQREVLETYQKLTKEQIVIPKFCVRSWEEAFVDGIVVQGNLPRVDHENRVNFIGGSNCSWAAELVIVEIAPKSGFRYQWPENGTQIDPAYVNGKIPYQFFVRCFWAMHVAEVQQCRLVVEMDNEIRVYTLVFNEFIFQGILAAPLKFHEEHILKDVPPSMDDSESTFQMIVEERSIPKEPAVEKWLDPTSEDVALAKEYNLLSKDIESLTKRTQKIKNIFAQKTKDYQGVDGVCEWRNNTIVFTLDEKS